MRHGISPDLGLSRTIAAVGEGMGSDLQYKVAATIRAFPTTPAGSSTSRASRLNRSLFRLSPSRTAELLTVVQRASHAASTLSASAYGHSGVRESFRKVPDPSRGYYP